MSRARNRSKLPENRACRMCGTSSGHISKRLLCADCRLERMTFAAVDMRARSGPSWDAWKAGMRRAADSR